ncbi:hypothetical protein [Aeromonas caviae]|uniref:hypothetical protein n=1 Tax=Aeromonas TaxID=642 RepID=UPI0029DA88D8|nr:hypothetical protein [Aeromonas caviae]MDX7682921.1 hypothetical protein [Aeromonas caviae]MDX7728664.1 hypothetical protein [Aeromonas caviae]
MDFDFTKVNTIQITNDDSEPSIFFGPVIDPVMCGKSVKEMNLTFVLDTNLYSDICHNVENKTFQHFLMVAARNKIMLDPSFAISEQSRVSTKTAKTHLQHYRKHVNKWFSIEIPESSEIKLLDTANQQSEDMKSNIRLLEHFLSMIKYIYRSPGNFESKKEAYLKSTSGIDIPQFGFILACGYLIWYAKEILDNNNPVRKKIDAFMSIGDSPSKEDKILHNTATDISLFHNCLTIFSLKYKNNQEFPILATRDTVVGFLLKHLTFSHIFDEVGHNYRAGLFLRKESPWFGDISDDFYSFIKAASKPLSKNEQERAIRIKNLEALSKRYV